MQNRVVLTIVWMVTVGNSSDACKCHKLWYPIYVCNGLKLTNLYVVDLTLDNLQNYFDFIENENKYLNEHYRCDRCSHDLELINFVYNDFIEINNNILFIFLENIVNKKLDCEMITKYADLIYKNI